MVEALLAAQSHHYEATHDVVGRVKIQRFLNPGDFWNDAARSGEDYLMAEVTILDLVENDRVLVRKKKKRDEFEHLSTNTTEEEDEGIETPGAWCLIKK